MVLTDKLEVGYCLIGVVPALMTEAYDALLKNEAVTDCHAIFGEFDYIAKVKTTSLKEFSNNLKHLRSITDTMYLVINTDLENTWNQPSEIKFEIRK